MDFRGRTEGRIIPLGRLRRGARPLPIAPYMILYAQRGKAGLFQTGGTADLVNSSRSFFFDDRGFCFFLKGVDQMYLLKERWQR